MTPRQILYAACAAAVAVSGLWCRSCVSRHRDKVAIQQADTAHNSETANAAKGAVYDQQANDGAQTIKADEAEVERLRRGLAKLRTTRTAIGPNTPRTPDVALPAPDLAPIVAGLEALNGALTKENTNLKTQVVTITLARDSYRAALGDCQRETACLRLAHDAQVAALKSERWKGRLEGLAVGFGAGYIGGRLH